MSWLNEDLKVEIKRVFEPRYGRELTDVEIKEITENLTGAVESILKFKWRNEYENSRR